MNTPLLRAKKKKREGFYTSRRGHVHNIEVKIKKNSILPHVKIKQRGKSAGEKSMCNKSPAGKNEQREKRLWGCEIKIASRVSRKWIIGIFLRLFSSHSFKE